MIYIYIYIYIYCKQEFRLALGYQISIKILFEIPEQDVK